MTAQEIAKLQIGDKASEGQVLIALAKEIVKLKQELLTLKAILAMVGRRR